jgi:plasmid stability protein
VRKVDGRGKAVLVLRCHAVETNRKVEAEFREFLNKALEAVD